MQRVGGGIRTARSLLSFGERRYRHAPLLPGSHSLNSVGETRFGAHHANARHFVTACSRYCLAPNRLSNPGEAAEPFTSLKCPECGKRFLSVANLQQHRRSRHLVLLKSPSQEQLERLREENARLLDELRNLQETNTLRARSASSLSTASTESSSTGESRGGKLFPAAVPDGKAVGISMGEVQQLREHPFRLGTCTSEVWCVGMVEGDVELGKLGVDTAQEAGEEHLTGLEAMQFTLQTDGYRLRRVGQLKMYRNRLTVRVIAPRYRAQKGDIVLVTGTYGLHKSYDLVSKQAVENTVVEAGYVGLLLKGPVNAPEIP
ncbi:hypothetical protein TraAM80_08167 [Trypanosoma rangeli]|uniref:C2H2-type domain-containing protein n=1 Tax=Trypanosoma rangeli TaxID=5698 RepID=A0A422N1Y8_TRYRA|nr:uncharacterized protein TraAM80_08167 [Trypanosoma rangeli]RNE99475.1 hypothetical protein TraAM80_08167 [Trypanosoma rangeli]|eukprot:RNE99475.1 hypothetical protein TraAM80_08167 [Trypanosoma rangeli]